MRALFMDFPNDAHVAAIGDEYMFGPAFRVAPVTEQGVTYRHETGDLRITRFHWNECGVSLSHEGVQPWTGADAAHLEVIGR